MISFRISAPGKVILFGEHAVVYGKTAVAASLDLRSSLDFNELPLNETDLQVEMPKFGISLKIDVAQVRRAFFYPDFPKLNSDGHEEFYRRIQEFVDTLDFDDPCQKNSLECFFYSLVQVAQEQDGFELRAFKAVVNTELSIGAGTGSSASFAVCLVAGFLHWSQLQGNNSGSKFDLDDLGDISRYALNCERIMHGRPSGIDNSICTWGSVIKFHKGGAPGLIPLALTSLRILLVDSKVNRSTKVQVGKLAALATKYPEIFHKILEAIDGLSKRAIDIIIQLQAVQNDTDDRLLEACKELSVLIDINQGLLSTCQLSHPALDMICSTAKKYGFSAKFTGAGGGGFAYVLIPPDASKINQQNLSAELIENGFSVIQTNLGGPGVEIHEKQCS